MEVWKYGGSEVWEDGRSDGRIEEVSIKTSRSAEEKKARATRNKALDNECSKWNDNQERMLRSNNVFASLPACPPTQDRAELPNSGLEEARFDSVLYTTDYHNQWMETFHHRAAICFTQATVARQVKNYHCLINKYVVVLILLFVFGA